MRLEESLIGRIDEYAESRLSNRTAVVQAACLAFLGGAKGGVPELEEAPSAAPSVARPVEQKGPRTRLAMPSSPAPPRASGKPERTSFESGEDWQNAVRLWRARED